jgi:hypothetical protein
MVRTQCLDLPLKILDRGKGTVDGGKPQIGNLIKFSQRTEYRQPHLVAGHLGRTGRPNGVLHLLGQKVERIIIDLAPLTRSAYSANDLFAAERLRNAAALYNGQHSRFHGSETPSTFRTGTTPADGLPLVSLAGIDYPRVGMTAKRAMHDRSFATEPL